MTEPKEQWRFNERLIEAWIRTVGNAERPYGDYWRMMLVNPVVLMVASLMAQQEGVPKIERVPLDLALAAQRERVSSAEFSPLVEWHRSMIEEHDLSSLKILDLGCGEGYLGRWLSSMGACYLGIDASPQLIEEGNRRSASEPNCGKVKLLESDIEGDAIPDQLLDTLLEPMPHLVTGVIILEHLDSPVPFLRKLSEGLNHEQCQLLFFVLNPDYLEVDQFAGGTQRIRAKIASADQEVDCMARSLFSLHQVFRDSRLRVIHEVPLALPFSHRAVQEPHELRGVAPFYAFLLRPFPSPAELHKETLESALAKGFLKQVDDRSRTVLRDNLRELSLVSFEANETILPQNNLGGDLFMIMEGSADLWVDGKVVSSYSAGELLGDLEAGRSDSDVSYFPYPVKSGNQGALVLQIPVAVAKLLMEFSPSMAGSLFNQLRNRLVIALWNYNNRRRSTKNIMLPTDLRVLLSAQEPDKELSVVHKTYVDRVSRVLLSSCDVERLSGTREQEGRGVFMSSKMLVEKAQIELEASSLEALRSLMSLGVVDCFPGAYLRAQFPELYRESWKLTKHEAAEAILRDAHNRAGIKKQWSDIRRQISEDDAVVFDRAMTGNKGWSRAVKGLLEHVMRFSASTEWHSSVIKYIEFIGRMNCFWWDKAPSYIVIHDPWLLRAFVLEDEEFLDARIIARSLAASPELLRDKKPMTFVELTALIAQNQRGRGRVFVRRLSQFFINDLKTGGGLRFSGSQDGYTLPPAPLS